MPMSTRRAVFLAKTEDTYGVDSGPVAANALMALSGLDIKITGDKIERDVLRDTFSSMGHVIGAKSAQITAKLELAGAGIDGTGKPKKPAMDPLLLACGLQYKEVALLTKTGGAGVVTRGATATGATSNATGTVLAILGSQIVVAVTDGEFAVETVNFGGAVTATIGAVDLGHAYHPITRQVDQQKSASLYLHKDGILHKMFGSVGTFGLDVSVGKYGLLDFSLTGLFSNPLDAALPAVDFSGFPDPAVAVNCGLVLGSYSPVVQSVKLDLGNEIAKRPDLNASEGFRGFYVKGRKAKGSLDPEVDALGNFNPWDAWKNATLAALTMNVGQTPGNRVRVHVPASQFDEASYTDRDGTSAYNLPFTCRAAGAGDDELLLLWW